MKFCFDFCQVWKWIPLNNQTASGISAEGAKQNVPDRNPLSVKDE